MRRDGWSRRRACSAPLSRSSLRGSTKCWPTLYFTDPTLDLPKGEKQELAFQGVYRLGKDGSVRLLTSDLVQPNGLAFSPDGKRLYIDDTKQREIRVYDVGAGGELKNGRLFGKEEGRGGVPDGMRVDVKGNVYVDGAGRNLGLGSRWQPPGHDRVAGVGGEPQLGRRRLSYALHHRQDVGVSHQSKSARFCSGRG